jgi:hypothetical protein
MIGALQRGTAYSTAFLNNETGKLHFAEQWREDPSSS